jgi:hypothetical protein
MWRLSLHCNGRLASNLCCQPAFYYCRFLCVDAKKNICFESTRQWTTCVIPDQKTSKMLLPTLLGTTVYGSFKNCQNLDIRR